VNKYTLTSRHFKVLFDITVPVFIIQIIRWGEERGRGYKFLVPLNVFTSVKRS